MISTTPTIEELINDKEFLGFCEVWKANYRVEPAMYDWCLDRGYDNLAEGVKWCIEQPDETGAYGEYNEFAITKGGVCPCAYRVDGDKENPLVWGWLVTPNTLYSSRANRCHIPTSVQLSTITGSTNWWSKAPSFQLAIADFLIGYANRTNQ